MYINRRKVYVAYKEKFFKYFFLSFCRQQFSTQNVKCHWQLSDSSIVDVGINGFLSHFKTMHIIHVVLEFIFHWIILYTKKETTKTVKTTLFSKSVVNQKYYKDVKWKFGLKPTQGWLFAKPKKEKNVAKYLDKT